MTIAYGGNGGNPAFNASNSVVANVPAGVSNTNLMIAHVWQEAQNSTPATCAGWISGFNFAGPSVQFSLFYRYASSEPASYTFTSSGGTVATAMTARIHYYTGAVTAGNPFDAIGAGDSQSSGLTTLVNTSITTVTDGCLIQQFIGNFDGSDAVSSYPAGFTGNTYTGNATIKSSYLVQATHGATGTATITLVSNDDIIGVLAAIKPAGGATIPLMGQICL